MVNAQEWLDKNYPRDGVCLIDESIGLIDNINNQGKRRSGITELNISNNDLTGSIDLAGFINLEKLYCSGNEITELDLTSCCSKLKLLNCSNNRLINLDIGQCFNLEDLDFSYNQIKSLILPQINKLKYINTSNNPLSSFDYSALNPDTLTDLRIINNNLDPTDVSVLSNLINLTNLHIGSSDYWFNLGNKGNEFYGSLKSLQNLIKLERLSIWNVELKQELEYLPLGLNDIDYIDKKGEVELIPYGNNLTLWKFYHSDLLKKAGREAIDLEVFNFGIKKAIDEPPFLKIKPRKEELIESFHGKYDKIFFQDCHPLGQWKENKAYLQKEIFPTRLYHIPTNTVVLSKDIHSVNSYVVLSYAWGDLSDKDNLVTWDYAYQNDNGEMEGKKIGVNEEFKTTGTTKQSIKALRKSVATLEFINKDLPAGKKINYLWMDQLCINQFDHEEQSREVPKMRQYYDQANFTLISINDKIGKVEWGNESYLIDHIVKKILISPWFYRVWTFQEGVLSKQTIFMFDDCLVDGRRLALFWGGYLSNYSSIPQTFITPLGWSYNKGNKEQGINLTIGEALAAVSNRQRTVAVDSVYAILGLLPYGSAIDVKYKPWGQKYTKEELESVLLDLIEKSYSHDPKELITYLGERNPNNWWLPMVNEDTSFSVWKSLNENDGRYQYTLSRIKQINRKGIQLIGHYTILENNKKVIEIDRDDEENNANWNEVLQITLSGKNEPIVIKYTDRIYYSEKGFPQELFINLIEHSVITRRDNFNLYYQLTEWEPNETILFAIDENIEGLLDLSKFVNLELLFCGDNKISSLILPKSETLKKIYCYNNVLNDVVVKDYPNLINLGIFDNQLRELDISQNNQLSWLNCNGNQLSSLNLVNNYQLEVLYCSSNKLNSLNLEKNENLIELHCYGNELTSLNLSNLSRLEIIEASDNLLTNFNYSILNTNTLTTLNISNNNLPLTDISVFSDFINLERLGIGSWNEDNVDYGHYSERIEARVYNRFYGSLKSWKNLTKLKVIDISNTDVDDGLEYLPNTLEEMYYSTKERPDCKLIVLENQLKPFVREDEDYEPANWKTYWARLKNSKWLESEESVVAQIEQLSI